MSTATASPDSETTFSRVVFFLAAACAVTTLVSIAASQILLALAFVALLLSGVRLRIPRFWPFLVAFMAGTVISWLASGSIAAGRPQIRKFYVYLMLVVIFSAFRRLAQVRALVLCWAGVASVAAGIGLVQFARKVQEAPQHGQSLYDYYVQERITGFMSNWQTFSGQQMMALLLIGAFLMFSPRARGWMLWFALVAAAAIGGSVILGYTRGVWLATAVASLYLLWKWKRVALLALPVLIVLVLWLNPGAVRARFQSSFSPHGQTDSNQHRIVCWRTGWQMIKAHPWLGLGPEQVGPKLMQYVPADIPRPLPTGWYGHLHSIYIHYAAERGVATMLALIAMLIVMIRDALRALKRLPAGRSDEKCVLHGLIAVVIAIMVSGIFELNLGDSEVLAMFLAWAACGYVAVESAEAARV